MDAVTGSAIAQNSVWLLSMFRMSEVFIPNTEAINDRGRKTMVTSVKMRIALELPSSRISMLCRSALVALSKSLRNCEKRISMLFSRSCAYSVS